MLSHIHPFHCFWHLYSLLELISGLIEQKTAPYRSFWTTPLWASCSFLRDALAAPSVGIQFWPWHMSENCNYPIDINLNSNIEHTGRVVHLSIYNILSFQICSYIFQKVTRSQTLDTKNKKTSCEPICLKRRPGLVNALIWLVKKTAIFYSLRFYRINYFEEAMSENGAYRCMIFEFFIPIRYVVRHWSVWYEICVLRIWNFHRTMLYMSALLS